MEEELFVLTGEELRIQGGKRRVRENGYLNRCKRARLRVMQEKTGLEIYRARHSI